MRKKNAYPQTLCWRCANEVPDREGERGCTWSRSGVPVAGWEAVRRDLRLGRLSDGVKLESYRVQKCPCFAPDEQSKAEKLALMAGYGHELGRVVDKLTRDRMVSLKYKEDGK